MTQTSHRQPEPLPDGQTPTPGAWEVEHPGPAPRLPWEPTPTTWGPLFQVPLLLRVCLFSSPPSHRLLFCIFLSCSITASAPVPLLHISGLLHHGLRFLFSRTCIGIEVGSHAAQTGLEPSILCLHLPSASVTGVCHPTRLLSPPSLSPHTHTPHFLLLGFPHSFKAASIDENHSIICPGGGGGRSGEGPPRAYSVPPGTNMAASNFRLSGVSITSSLPLLFHI